MKWKKGSVLCRQCIFWLHSTSRFKNRVNRAIFKFWKFVSCSPRFRWLRNISFLLRHEITLTHCLLFTQVSRKVKLKAALVSFKSPIDVPVPLKWPMHIFFNCNLHRKKYIFCFRHMDNSVSCRLKCYAYFTGNILKLIYALSFLSLQTFIFTVGNSIERHKKEVIAPVLHHPDIHPCLPWSGGRANTPPFRKDSPMVELEGPKLLIIRKQSESSYKNVCLRWLRTRKKESESKENKCKLWRKERAYFKKKNQIEILEICPSLPRELDIGDPEGLTPSFLLYLPSCPDDLFFLKS